MLPGWRRIHGLQSFKLLMNVSNLDVLEHSYRLPTNLHDEDSRAW